MLSPHSEKSIALLKQMIKTTSYSKEEDKVADLLHSFLGAQSYEVHRVMNNLYCYTAHYQESLPTLLLNSHIDTVGAVESWTKDPFGAQIDQNKLYGLGSNDAGASVVSLIACFQHFYHQKLPFNLMLGISAEEEISGANGIALLLQHLPKIDMAIVGEPTQMRMAKSERGLLVIDACIQGKAGHAARSEGINAITLALKDIDWILAKQASNVTGSNAPSMKVTMINAGSQHNVIPDQCTYVIDVRTTGDFNNEKAFETLSHHLNATLTARSFRLNASAISKSHPLFQVATALELATYDSPTLSDQALMPFPSIKMGPGKSARSHQADEFVYLSEIEEGIQGYIQFIYQLKIISQ